MNEQDTPQGNRSQELCRRVVTTESFIAEAKEIYGDRYDYSKVDYKNRDHRVVVTCPVHGDFQVYARDHLDGKGCPKCEKGEKFIAKLKEKFGDKFGLDEFVYESSTTPVTLICPTHGAFSKLPNQILNLQFGCPHCGNDAKEEIHNAAVARKEKIKMQKQKEREEFEKQRLNSWLEERKEREKIREHALKLFQSGKKPRDFYSPYQIYQGRVDEHIEGIRYGGWKTSYYASYKLSEEEAMKLSCYREGDLFYKFPNEAPDIFFREAYEKDYAYYGGSMEQHLSHRSCIIVFEGNDLIIQEESYEHEQQRFENQRPTKKSILKELPTDFVSIDFETLYSQRVSACSIGMVKYRDGKKVDQYYSLIRPPFDYPGKNGQVLTWVHGISEDDVRNEKTFVELLPEIEAFVAGLPLVAHNASVEKCCIRDVCAYYEIDTKLDYNNILDTLPLSREAEAKLGLQVEGQGTHSLDAVCRRFNVPVLNHHNAREDAEMCGNLIVKFRELLVEGKSVEMKADNGNQTETVKEEKVKNPSANQVEQVQNVEEQSSKGGCLGVVLVGLLVLSIIVFV
jgi:DNA polymerase III epsilon subunit-like protein